MNNKYTIIKQESIEELNGTGYILKHDKTGARVVVISNEDDNKVFHGKPLKADRSTLKQWRT